MAVPEDRIYDEIDVRVDGTVGFRFAQELLVPEEGGVYLIHDLRGVLYAGRTANLLRRFRQHYWAQNNPLLVAAIVRPVGELSFSWTLAEEGAEQARLERRLIRAFVPPCNRLRYKKKRNHRKNHDHNNEN